MESKGKGLKSVKSDIGASGSYYKGELSKLKVDSVYSNQVQITDSDGSKTKWLSLNVECIDEVLYYLQGLREEILKGRD